MPTGVLSGHVLQPGVALGGACLFSEPALSSPPHRAIDPGEVPVEQDRLRRAVAAVRDDLCAIADQVAETVSQAEADIFNAHVMILKDPSFIRLMEEHIAGEEVGAEAAVAAVIQEYQQQFRSMPDDFMRERAGDLKDIGVRLLKALGLEHRGFACHHHPGQEVVIVTRDLSTSLLSDIAGKKVAGILVEEGSPLSHGAILAKTLGVPILIRAVGALGMIGCGDIIVIDTDRGQALVNPERAAVNRYAAAVTTTREETHPPRQLNYAVTSCGTKIALWANAGTVADLDHARDRGMENVGLFRTEFIFMGRDTEPSLAEQTDIYRDIIDRVAGVVTFRLVDLGGDKIVSYVALPKTLNPFLGHRGVRLYAVHRSLIERQIEALLRAKGGRPLRLMVPMVTTIEEFIAVREMIVTAVDRLTAEVGGVGQELALGAMVEVPAVLPVLPELAREADFLSVGTNDLIQYLMGVDRNQSGMNDLINPLQPAVLRTLHQIVSVATAAGCEVTVCGEIAGDPLLARLLVGMGYRTLSVNPLVADGLADALAQVSIAALEEAVTELLRHRLLARVRESV